MGLGERVLNILVIGGGVIGLTTAARCLEAGDSVTLVAREITPETTSDVAAAFWSPGALLGGPASRAWALDSFRAFEGIASIPESGIAVVDQYTLADEAFVAPDLGPEVPVRDLPPGRFDPRWHGFTIAAPRIDVPVYMPWLLAHVRSLGSDVRSGEAVTSLEDASAGYDAVVNCAGLGAAGLAGDQGMTPIRGQVVLVRRPGGLPDDVVHAETSEGTTYIVPRSGDVLLGGVYEYGETSLDPAPATAEAIIDRCAAFYPELRAAEVLRHRVGLRPGRQTVRLQKGQLASGRPVVHNYGHGSIGHTLSWGCAGEVRRLLTASLN
jgi:D-amino-acid oxidase